MNGTVKEEVCNTEDRRRCNTEEVKERLIILRKAERETKRRWRAEKIDEDAYCARLGRKFEKTVQGQYSDSQVILLPFPRVEN